MGRRSMTPEASSSRLFGPISVIPSCSGTYEGPSCTADLLAPNDGKDAPCVSQGSRLRFLLGICCVSRRCKLRFLPVSVLRFTDG